MHLLPKANLVVFSCILSLLFSCKKKDDITPLPSPPPSSNKNILTFTFKQAQNTSYLIKDIVGSIGVDTVSVEVPAETDITKLSPDIIIDGKSISPASNIAQDFSVPVSYIVKAENGTEKKYTVVTSFRSTVFLESAGGIMYALDAVNGSEIWVNNNGKFQSGSPSVHQGLVYACGIDGLYALNAISGIEKWKLPVTGSLDVYEVLPTPLVKDGVVYIGLWDGYVYALNASDGSIRWKTPSTQGKVFVANVTINGNLLYAGCEDGNLYAMDIATGAVIWKYFTGGIIYGNPLLANNMIFVAGLGSTNAYLLNSLSGSLVWSRYNGTPFSSPTFDNGIIYTGGENAVYGIDISTGITVWYYHGLVDNERSGGIVLNGKYFSGGSDGTFGARNLSTKNLVWSVNSGYPVNSSPVISDGILYIANIVGDIYAVDAEVGAIKWSKRISGTTRGSVCAVDKAGLKHYASISGERN